MRNFVKQQKWSILFLFLAIILILFGIWRDEILAVWQNASAICLECIGIG